MFIDRHDAGEKLGHSLLEYKGREDTVIVALPRGGLVIAEELAKMLDLPIDVICSRKIHPPGSPEYAIGAITDTGQKVLEDSVIERLAVPPDYLQQETEEQYRLARAQAERYRQGLPPRDLKGKIVLLVDDGLATGSTMHAAAKTCRDEEVEEIVAAVPVGAQLAAMLVHDEVDDMICMDAPQNFQAVGQFYESFQPVEDEEVIRIMKANRKED